MKKIFISVLFVLAILVIASPAFALQCKQGNYGSDECWTEVLIDVGYTRIVSAGDVLVASLEGITAANNDGFKARHSIASKPGMILGVAQRSIATGDRDLILARGIGVVQLVGAVENNVASGDMLIVTEGSTLSSRAGAVVGADGVVGTAWDATSIVGVTMETQTTDDSANIAYIRVV